MLLLTADNLLAVVGEGLDRSQGDGVNARHASGGVW